MTRQHTVWITSLVLLSTVLVTLLGAFDVRRALVATEGNDLRATESIWVQASRTEILAVRSSFADGTLVFRDVEPGVRAVAVVRGRWTTVPLHSGRPLLGDSREALAGDGRISADGSAVVAGESYPVVGRLGLRAEGLLHDEIVVADPALFSRRAERLLLTGPDVERRWAEAFPGRHSERVETGANRRTNVDTVSPVLIGLGTAMIVLLTLSAGVTAGALHARAARIRFLVGARRSALVVSSGARLVGVALLAVAGAALVSGALGVSHVAVEIAIIGVLFVVSGSVTTWSRSRRWN